MKSAPRFLNSKFSNKPRKSKQLYLNHVFSKMLAFFFFSKIHIYCDQCLLKTMTGNGIGL